MFLRRIAISGIVAAATLSVTAAADTKSATACAAGLSKDAKEIYAATAPKITPASNLPDEIRSATVGLVMGGSIERENAKPAAQAAGACLAQLKG